ncbi:MAG TPA: efflux RND transporter periplasmic adaptor subunit, partial [Planctomycetota bacterium]|nr:efflux RND transporter periplasmic adaptor subunit [Planctomycetota bacterium]
MKNRIVAGGVVVGSLVAVAAMTMALAGKPKDDPPKAEGVPAGRSDPKRSDTIQLSERQVVEFKIQPAPERTFKIEREAVGSISFNEEMLVDVYPPVQGKITRLFARAGDDVEAGVPLYTIDSPDLVQAGSTLISAAGVLELTTRALKRARELHEVQGVAQKDLDQAVSDQQAAEAAYKAARDAVRIFGKTEAEMDRIVADRKIDPALLVRSPMAGRLTARNAAPGVLIQPGNPPAPYTLSDLSTLWML